MKRIAWKLGIGGACAAAVSLWWVFAQAPPIPSFQAILFIG